MKIKLILPTLLLSSNISMWAAEKIITNQVVIDNTKSVINAPVSKKSLYPNEAFEIKPYYSVLAAEGFKFNSAAVGTEVTFNINKYVGISLDAFGKDNTKSPTIDRAGTALTTTLPLNRRFAVYGQGGFGYWTGDIDEFDMVLRVGLKYKFTKNLGLSTDIGHGTSISGSTDSKNNSYQQIRFGLGLSF